MARLISGCPDSPSKRDVLSAVGSFRIKVVLLSQQLLATKQARLWSKCLDVCTQHKIPLISSLYAGALWSDSPILLSPLFGLFLSLPLKPFTLLTPSQCMLIQTATDPKGQTVGKNQKKRSQGSCYTSVRICEINRFQCRNGKTIWSDKSPKDWVDKYTYRKCAYFLVIKGVKIKSVMCFNFWTTYHDRQSSLMAPMISTSWCNTLISLNFMVKKGF